MAITQQRRCGRCGHQLSRYNDTDECAACASTRRTSDTAAVPSHLWLTTEMREALTRWDWKTVFRLVVAATDMSQVQLASLVGLSQPHVSRLMKGTGGSFDIRTINSIVDGLGAPRALAGLAPGSPDHGATVGLDPTKELSPVDRRALLVTSVTLPLAGILGRHARPRVVTHDYARQIRGLLPDLYSLDDHDGGVPVSDAARWCLREVDTLLGTAGYDDAAAHELQLAYGELAEMAGWLDFDAGRIPSAQWHFGEALRAAQLADDLNLEVLILGSMIMVARHRGRPREAIQLAQLAQRRAAGWGTPRLLSLLAVREATGWAQAGDASAADRAMRRALNTFEPTRNDDDPTWLSFYTDAELLASKASINMYLGRPGQAAAHMYKAINRLEPQYQRNRALFTARLALAYLHEGDDRQACAVLAATLPHLGTVRSGRARSELTEAITLINTRPRQEHTDEVLAQAAAHELLPAA
ncbi:helix-turn-helix domain-containing protein [Dactylosporangium darangshiense]|uniref:HTH cro/C1-type domain-containing protein n=1 Tax=Dactylosporangium darangshiense TaxID=579108 RepID=A0ABP8DI10_9ACTN